MWAFIPNPTSANIIIPNISKCMICEETLLGRLEELTEKARQTVFIIDDGSSSDEGEEAGDVDDDGVEGEEVSATSSGADDDANLATEIESFDDAECPRVEELLTEIWSWRRQTVHMQ